MRRAILWIGRGLLGLTGLLVLGIAALFVFPVGCPISRYLPATVTETHCLKRGNFPETRYALSAKMTRDEFKTFVDTLQGALQDGDWEIKTRDNGSMLAKHSSSLVILTIAWKGGDMSADWFAM